MSETDVAEYKAFDQNAKSRGGFNVTKPIFSNSAKRY